jgi:signal transduction histidine kinase
MPVPLCSRCEDLGTADADPDIPEQQSILEMLVGVVQDLSLARDLPSIMQTMRGAMREATGADGATFILREGDLCYYAEENAIAPLWKGRRFPLSVCICGWVMQNHQTIAIEDVFADPRIPLGVYEPTFVKSLAMAPIRTKSPLGALGIYWATKHRTTRRELAVLRMLADSTSVAMENVDVYAELEKRVRDRTHELEAKNQELQEQHEALVKLELEKEALSAHVVHDLKSPASAIMLAASMGLRAEGLSPVDRRRWSAVLSSAEHIHRTALNLLEIAGSNAGRLVPAPVEVDLGALLAEVCELFRFKAEGRGQAIELRVDVPPSTLRADPELLRRVVQNLVDNALRHSPTRSTVQLTASMGTDGVKVAVADEGAGVPTEMRDRIFDRYVSLADDSDGSHTARGLGLTFCRLAVEAHGGNIWIEDNEPRGSRFCFRVPSAAQSSGV